MAGRTVGRAIGGRIGGSLQHPKPHDPSKPSNLPLSTKVFASSQSSSSSSSSFATFGDCDGCGMSFVLDGGSKRRLCRKCIYGSIPSQGEAQDALSALLQTTLPGSCSEFTDNQSEPSTCDALTDKNSTSGSMHIISSGGSKLGSVEPMPLNSNILQSCNGKRVSDTFRLLHSEPSIQRMVTSLATDKAVWDAVMNNQVVREVRDKLFSAENDSVEDDSMEDSSQKGPRIAATCVVKWVIHNTKVLVAELIEKIIKLMIAGFQSAEEGKPASPLTYHLEEALTSSLLLTVVILLIVLVSRVNDM